MNIKPLAGYLVVKSVKKEEVTKSGIYLPDTVDKEKKAEGEIVAVGQGKMLDNGERAAVEVAVGDIVLFKKWGGEDVELDGEEYKIISHDDVMAILQK